MNISDDPIVDSTQVVSSLKNVWTQENATENNKLVSSLSYDVYTPKNCAANGKYILSFHPGGFTGGKPSNDKAIDMANQFCPEGYTVFCPQYSEIPQADTVKYSDILNAVKDGNDFLQYVETNLLNQYHLTSGKCVVMGCSAGAIIALHMAYANQNELPSGSIDINCQNSKIVACIDCWGSMPSAYMQKGDKPCALFCTTTDPTIPPGCMSLFGLTSCGAMGLQPVFDSLGIFEVNHFWTTKNPVHGVKSSTFVSDAIPVIETLFGHIGF